MKRQAKDRKSGQNVLINPQGSCALTNDFFDGVTVCVPFFCFLQLVDENILQAYVVY